MKSLLYAFSLLIIIGLSGLELNAQDQSLNQETTPADPASQEPQNSAVAPVNQTPAKAVTVVKPKQLPEDLNISDQFTFAIEKSSNFQDYKVIKQVWMEKLKSNALDTIVSLKTNLKSAKEQIQEKTKMLLSLNTELNNAQTELTEKNSFKFFGIMVSKTGYDSIMWSIIVGLVVSLGFMFAAFRRSHAVTSQTKKDLEDVKEEFEQFRKKALKSKEEAVRQLYDELNKYKNMK